MKQLFLQTTLIAFLFVAFSACQKDAEEQPAVKTKTELITTGSWQFDKAMSGSADVSGSVPACYKDNVVTFTSATNGTVLNTVVCTPTDITPATFTWSFQSSETVLRLSAPFFPGGTGDFTIVSLTATALVVSQNVTFPPSPAPINITFHYKH